MTERSGVFWEWSRRYLIEYLIALALCAVSAGFCIPWARTATSDWMRALRVAVPAASILLAALVVYRHFLRVDEFLRRVMLESFAIAGAVTSIWTLIYAMGEAAGFPRISIWWVWGSLMLVWNLATFAKWMFRR